jgi:hypothetical protein
MTRADIAESMRKDGGVSGIYKQERYFFSDLSFAMSLNGLSVGGLVCKLNMDFKPKGMPLEVYNDPDRFHQWWIESHRGSRPSDSAKPGLLKRFWRTMSYPFRPSPKGSTPSDRGTDVVVRVSSPFIDLVIYD